MRVLLLLSFLFAAPSLAVEPVDFTLPDLEGKPVSLSDYRGKWVIVNYWATWCPPCLEEIPDLVDLYENNRDKLVVLGVDHEEVTRPLGGRLGWPVLGRELLDAMAIDAVNNNDFPILQAVTLFFVLAYVVMNFIADVMYAVIDPRIRYG